MLTLLLMRHAKSGWDHPELGDHQRELTKRGKEDAKHMAGWLASQNLVPEVVLCSSAVRAKSTAELVLAEVAFEGEAFYVDELYQCGTEDFVRALNNVDQGRASPVMIVGHNPEMEEAVQAFSGEETKLGTATIACIQFEITSWGELTRRARGKLARVARPKEIT